MSLGWVNANTFRVPNYQFTYDGSTTKDLSNTLDAMTTAKNTVSNALITTNTTITNHRSDHTQLSTDVKNDIKNLSTELVVRTTGDSTLTTDLSTELVVRAAGDATQAANLSTELVVRAAADDVLTSNLSTELVVRAAADDVLTDNLSTEVVNRTTADTTLTSNLSTELVVRAAADDVLTDNLSTEVVNRTAADTTLTNNLSTELVVRAAGDATQAANLSTELVVRAAADTTLTNNLSTELVVRAAGDATQAADLSTELVVRAAEDATLSTNIVNTNTTVSSVSTAVVTNRSELITMINDRDAGLDPKGSVRAATNATFNTTGFRDALVANLSGSVDSVMSRTNLSTALDNIVLVDGDRVLIKNCMRSELNGIYTWAGANSYAQGKFTRAADFNATSEVTAGAFVFVEEGTKQANSGYVLSKLTTAAGSGTWALGTDPQSWVQFSGSHLFTADATTGLNIESNKISILDNGIKTAQISDGVVTAAKIASGAITGAKFADSTITAAKLSLDVATSAIALSSNGVSLKGTGSSTVQLQTSADVSGVQYLQAVWVNGATTKITNLAPLA